MTRREKPVVDAPIDRQAALKKVLAEAHAKGAHVIPLGKCDACRADPEFEKKQNAALVVHTPAAVPTQPGRKVKLDRSTPANPTGVSPKRAPKPAPEPDAPINMDALGDDAAIDLIVPGTPLLGDPPVSDGISPRRGKNLRGRINGRPTTSTAGEQVAPAAPEAPIAEAQPVPADPPVVEPLDEPVIVELPSGRKVATHTPTALAEPIATPKRVNAKGRPKTREEWLLRAVDMLRPDFEKAGLPIGDVRVSIGWMGGRGSKKNVIGQCWMPFSVEDKVPAIFLIPTLKKPVDILGVLVHELVHAGGCPGHRGKFATTAAKVGLMPPWPSTKPSDPLAEKLVKIAEKLGDFPHAVINPGKGLIGEGPERPPVQGTRMLKVVCPEDGYTVRTTAKWLSVGFPACPDGHEMERAE